MENRSMLSDGEPKKAYEVLDETRLDDPGIHYKVWSF